MYLCVRVCVCVWVLVTAFLLCFAIYGFSLALRRRVLLANVAAAHPSKGKGSSKTPKKKKTVGNGNWLWESETSCRFSSTEHWVVHRKRDEDALKRCLVKTQMIYWTDSREFCRVETPLGETWDEQQTTTYCYHYEYGSSTTTATAIRRDYKKQRIAVGLVASFATQYRMGIISKRSLHFSSPLQVPLTPDTQVMCSIFVL